MVDSEGRIFVGKHGQLSVANARGNVLQPCVGGVAPTKPAYFMHGEDGPPSEMQVVARWERFGYRPTCLPFEIGPYS